MREHTYHRRVEWADTDMAGIVHFARFFVFMETAEHSFREALGFPLGQDSTNGAALGWPRVAATCDYRRPARFGDELEVRTRIVEQGTTSLTFAFTFTRAGEAIAEGRMTSVCCRLEPRLQAVSIPERLAAAIEVVVE
ncbi:MAG TPA: thioesterase family protein [Thermoanaerobaculia bacterium]|nr:thioesterase family protein [Thermoanaerobaculia bacterium]